ncbi:hypothetical protein [Clostridium minihomine]|nr:hypothetical protein [Clostridium minihomine]
MDDKILQELQLVNIQLNTIIRNQALLYEKLDLLENKTTPLSPDQG